MDMCTCNDFWLFHLNIWRAGLALWWLDSSAGTAYAAAGGTYAEAALVAQTRSATAQYCAAPAPGFNGAALPRPRRQRQRTAPADNQVMIGINQNVGVFRNLALAAGHQA
jgi:hypothetical protein